MKVISQEKESVRTQLSAIFNKNKIQYTMIAVLLLIWIIFAIVIGMHFLSFRNLSNLFIQMVPVAVLACGMLLVMISGNIDLSVGSVCGAMGAMVAVLMVRYGLNPVMAIIFTLFFGFLVGAVYGFLIAYVRFPAIIVTLAGFIFYRGLTMLLPQNQGMLGNFSPSFREIGLNYLPEWFLQEGNNFSSITILIPLAAVLIFIIKEIYVRVKRTSIGFPVLNPSLLLLKIIAISFVIIGIGYIFFRYQGIPYAFIILLVIIGITHIILNRAPVGRHIYATGDNREATRLSGINTKNTQLYVFMLMGVFCAVSAIVTTSRNGYATTGVGNHFEIDAINTIAACLIGGTSMAGGIGTLFGAIIGALIVTSIDSGMSLMNLTATYQYLAKGIVLLLAIFIDTYFNKRK